MSSFVGIAICLVALLLPRPVRAETQDNGTTTKTRGKSGKVGGGIQVVVNTETTPSGKPRTASSNEKAARVWVNPCPAGAYRGYWDHPTTKDDGSTWAYQQYRCKLDGGWDYIYVCVADCPVGVTAVATEPIPPTLLDVTDRITQDVVLPVAKFAPPLERSPTIKAVVGKRLYYRVDPATYTEFSRGYGWDYNGNRVDRNAANARWFADVLFVPYAMTLKVPDGQITCDGPGHDGTTQAGRDAANAEGCFDIIESRPKSGAMPATIVTTWSLIINSNIDGVPNTFNHNASVNAEIRIKELQAIVIK